jgi:tRNA (mo5U34)-methyltransferase
MNHLEYLKPYEKHCDLSALQEIVQARELHWGRSGSDTLKQALDLDIRDEENLIKACELLIPWKKGPFDLSFGLLDAEWRSDFKWDRFQSALGDIKGKVILDVGCNNGYFMFQMAKLNPKLVLGIDPIPRCQAQFMLLNKIYQHESLKFELLGVEHCHYFKNFFDKILFMGIIYHHRHPLEQLINLREALKPGGELILETIGIPGTDSVALFPEDRFAGMKNIYFIPTLSCTVNWLKKAKFDAVEVIADSDMTLEEQRSTRWNPETFKTLKDSLDPKDMSKTIEGHPAPRRFLVKARKKG